MIANTKAIYLTFFVFFAGIVQLWSQDAKLYSNVTNKGALDKSIRIGYVEEKDYSNQDKLKKKQQKQKEKIDKIIKNAKIDAFVKTIASKERVNPSDTLSVTYRLYSTSEDFKIVAVNLPTSKGFFSQNYRPYGEQGKQETVKGVKYFTFDFYKTILQPRDNRSATFDDGSIKLLYYIKTGEKMQGNWGREYEVIGEKTIELKIDGFSVSVFELIEI